MSTHLKTRISLSIALALGSGGAFAQTCADLPSHTALAATLKAVVSVANNGGFKNNMWATLVNRDGEVCAVVFTGADRGDQFPGSRVISAQKANTANAFSLPGLALSTANLYSAVQPGGTIFGLQHSNPVDADVAYAGPAVQYGQPNDPLVGKRIGGVNVFAGGLALYQHKTGKLLGGLGVSGDTSCTDHNVAWRVRDHLNLDKVPAGFSPTNDDNIINDVQVDPITGHTTSPSGWGHPRCDPTATSVGGQLPKTNPVGP